jgi:Lon protease-like protein
MFPLSAVLFPHSSITLHVFEPRYRALTQDCLEGDGRLGIVLIARGSEVGGGDERTGLGTRGVITEAEALSDGRWLLRVQGETRLVVDEWLPDDPYPRALVTEPTPVTDLDAGESLLSVTEQRVRRIRALLSEHGGPPALSADTPFDHEDPEANSWQLCAAAPVSAYDAQRLLAADPTRRRLDLLGELMDDLELDLQRLHASE